MTTTDPYATTRDTTEGKVFTVTGQDWDSVVSGLGDAGVAAEPVVDGGHA